MTELRQNPSVQDLLDRIIRLERMVHMLHKAGRITLDHGERLMADSERINKLELAVFPKLRDDLAELRKIIGGHEEWGEWEEDPLDRRPEGPSCW